MNLGGTILKKRQERGLSQEKLAEQVGVSRQAVSKWEVGDAIPDTDKLIPLARALGITVDELLGNVPEEGGGEESAEPPVSGEYTCWESSDPTGTKPEKKPGWFATHWYWLGLIPAVWGAWQLLKLIVILVSALLFTANVSVGGSYEVIPEISVGAEQIVVEGEGSGFSHFIEVD